MKIEKGQKYLCVSQVIMDKDPKCCAYTQGQIYTSEADGRITDNFDNKDHWWDITAEFNKSFQPLSSAKWAIKRTPENAEVVNRWANETFHKEHENCNSFIYSDGTCFRHLLDGYTEIDFETFKEITGMREEKREFIEDDWVVGWHCENEHNYKTKAWQVGQADSDYAWVKGQTHHTWFSNLRHATPDEIAAATKSEKQKQLLGDKEAVHCPTLELAEKVIDIFSDNGIDAKKSVKFYGSRIAFIIENGKMYHANKSHFELNGYTIIPAEKFIKDNEQKQSEKEVPKFEKGDTVVISQCSKETYWYADKIGEVFVLEEERPSGNWVINGSLCSTLNPYDIQKIFTIEDVRNGKCAIENDGTVHQIRTILAYAFPESGVCANDFKYYMQSGVDSKKWVGNNYTDLPTQSVKLFLSQIESEKTPIQKAVEKLGEVRVKEIIDEVAAKQPVEEWQPKWGEEVEVRDYEEQKWQKALFVGLNPNENQAKYITVRKDKSGVGIWSQIRQPIHEFTTEQAKQDLAKLHNLNPEQIKITE